MKRRTTITTRKHEVWVIRPPVDSGNDDAADLQPGSSQRHVDGGGVEKSDTKDLPAMKERELQGDGKQ